MHMRNSFDTPAALKDLRLPMAHVKYKCLLELIVAEERKDDTMIKGTDCYSEITKICHKFH